MKAMTHTQSDFAGGGAGCESPSQPSFIAPPSGLSGARMNDLTWRKHYRKVWDNPMVTMTGWLAVWIWLLDHATHNGWDVIWKGERITLRPGQLTCGRNQISKATGVCPPQVQRVMSVLKRDNQIIIQTSNVCSLISIVNWDKYQAKYQPKYQGNISGISAEYQRNITKQEGEEGKNLVNTIEPPAGFPASQEAAKNYTGAVGCPPEFAMNLWNDLAAVGWKDGAGREISSFQHYLAKRWRESQQTQPRPSSAQCGASTQGPSESVKMIMAQKELDRVEARLEQIKEQAAHTALGIMFTPGEKKERAELLNRKVELKKQLGFQA